MFQLLSISDRFYGSGGLVHTETFPTTIISKKEEKNEKKKKKSLDFSSLS